MGEDNILGSVSMLQNDFLEIYNSLVIFSDDTVKSNLPIPIKVFYEKDTRLLVFEQRGKSARLYLPIYYCLDLDSIQKPTYLLPEDYDYLMSTLQNLIGSGILLKERTLCSPENCGMDIYSTKLENLNDGLDIIGMIRFISGNSWFFKWKVKRKYKGRI
jgi:hypothetical protein